MIEATRTRLLQLLKQRSLIFRDARRPVTLSSGEKSTYYIDGKMVLMHGESAGLIGELLYEMTRELNLDAIGGPEIGAIPMTTAAVLRYHQAGRDVEGFSVRKELKRHGTQKRIEGAFQSGYRVAIVEDVITQGTSVLQAIEAVQNEGGKIEVVICLVDRLQGAREKIEALGLKFIPIFTIADLGVLDDSKRM